MGGRRFADNGKKTLVTKDAEILELTKKLEEHSKAPGAWNLPH